jgi:hypothetical protein
MYEALRYLRAVERGESPSPAVAEMDEAVIDAVGPEMLQEGALIRLARAREVGGLREQALALAESTVSARAERGGTVEWLPYLWSTAVDWLLEAGTPEDVAAAGKAVAVVAAAQERRELALTAEVRRLRADGRAAIGFGAGRGYPFDEFLADSQTAGLVPDLLLSTWHLHPFRPDSEFLVAILRLA